MRLALRVLASLIAIAGVIDPVVARKAAAPLAVDVRLPKPSDPTYARALALRDRLQLQTGGVPQAIVAIGDAEVDGDPGVPVFALALERPSVELVIRELRAPSRTVTGQQAHVDAVVQARGLSGRKAVVTLEQDGVTVDEQSHPVASGDETFTLRLAPAPSASGLRRMRIVARAAGAADAVADAALVVRDRRLRVVAYEPRPSWPMTFVRRSLESDPLFELSAVTRTSRGITSRLGAPLGAALWGSAPLGTPDAPDAVIVGAPDALADREVASLLRFVAERGGRLILLPDRTLPEPRRRQFGLPPLEEVLHETPVDADFGGRSLRASELLVPPDRKRTALLTIPHGAGEILFSGALDAWRFRDEKTELLWRGLVADAALATPPPISVSLDRALVRPGEEIAVTVSLLGTPVPSVRAWLTDERGGREMIRLWPAASAGLFTGTVKAPAAGRFTVTAGAAGLTAEDIGLTAGDVVHPRRDMTRALAFTALATNGAAASSPQELAARLRDLAPGQVDTRAHPMRSPWWLAAFTAALGLEWALRRRAGQR